jgi:Kef-type K+ transport system membrane component KefB
MSDLELARAAIALTALLVAAHGGRRLFHLLRQPPVIGEILGGLLLGPTVLGTVLPDVHAALLPTSGPVSVSVAVIAHFGLLLLMFVAGAEVRTLFPAGDRKPVTLIVVIGTLLPVIAAVLFIQVVDLSDYIGPAGSEPALVLVVVCAFTVMSLPVISRIMLDLGILNTRFARLVLSVAVVEDLLTYVALAVALSLAGERSGVTPPLLDGMHLPVGWLIAYHLLAVIAFAAAVLAITYALVRRRPERASVGGAAGQLVLILVLVGVCPLLGIPAMFGAFVAGLAVSLAGGAGGAVKVVQGFALAFFIPVYFASIGLKLNLLTDLVLPLTAAFIAVACAAKTLGVYTGGRLAGEPPGRSIDLAAAMNARGGPGIVLASTALAAGIISQRLFTTLILLAIFTSFAAAAWLRRRMHERPAAGRPAPLGVGPAGSRDG